MGGEPRWLTPEFVIGINRSVLVDGEPHAVRETSTLEAVLARPRNLYAYEDEQNVLILGLALLYALGSTQAFLQGNKRTAFVAFTLFLEANGYRWIHPDSIAAAVIIEEFVLGDLSMEKMYQWSRRWVAERTYEEFIEEHASLIEMIQPVERGNPEDYAEAIAAAENVVVIRADKSSDEAS